MLDRIRHAEWLLRANGRDVVEILDIERDIVPLADMLMDMGGKVIIIKCGARGMYYRSANAQTIRDIPLSLNPTEWADQEGFQHSFKPNKVVSATGAGDASIGAFLASALQGCTLVRCVERSTATGACCVEACDALSGILTFPELDRRIASGWALNE